MAIYTYIKKCSYRLYIEKNRIWSYLPVNYISLYGYRKKNNKEWLVDRLQSMLGNFDFFELKDPERIMRKKIIQDADRIINHDFEILGNKLKFNEQIKWKTDIRTRYEWPTGVFYRKLRRLTPNGTDIKIPWELSRCHHLLWLGETYLLLRDEKYAQEIVNQISDWIDNNPFMYTVNWTCSMDVAIRAVNWMYALHFIQSASCFDNSFTDKVSKSLFQHAFFIRHNLEKQIPYSNNHYTSDIVGLLYLGELFKDNKSGRKWKKFALKEFYKEIRLQTLSSGVHYERSISYHRLMTELHSFPIYFLIRCGESIPKDIIHIVKKMYEFCCFYTKSNGLAPMIGDNDDGRFLPFVRRDFRDHSYLNDKKSVENQIISCNLDNLFSTSSIGSKLFQDAGFAVLKNSEAQVIISNGDYSKCTTNFMESVQTHTHNDALSFELTIGKEDIVVDPGTYLYTSCPMKRNEFRSTYKHNTLVVDKEEQNILYNDRLFLLRRNSIRKSLKLNEDVVIGEYKTINGHLKHRRIFELKEGELVITDILHKEGKNNFVERLLHFGEGISPRIFDNYIIIDTKDYNLKISFESVGSLEIKDDFISPSFGVLNHSKTLINTFNFNKSIISKIIIKWTRTNNIE